MVAQLLKETIKDMVMSIKSLADAIEKLKGQIALNASADEMSDRGPDRGNDAW